MEFPGLKTPSSAIIHYKLEFADYIRDLSGEERFQFDLECLAEHQKLVEKARKEAEKKAKQKRDHKNVEIDDDMDDDRREDVMRRFVPWLNKDRDGEGD